MQSLNIGNRLSRLRAIISALAAIVLLLAACASDPEEEEAQGDQQSVACLLGGTPPLSGISASTGEGIVNGGDLAASQASEELGVEVRTEWRDGQNSPEPTVNGLQGLASEGAAGVLVNGTDPLLASAELGPELETIVFNIAAVTPQQREMNEYVFANAVLADTESSQMVDLIEQRGHADLVIVNDDNAFGGMFESFVRAEAEDRGLTVGESVPVTPGQADLRAQLRPLQDQSPVGAVVLASTGVTPGTAIKQAKELGVEAGDWVGEQFTWTPDGLEAAGDAANGAIATTPLFDPTASERASQFAEDYEAEYDSQPGALAGRAYDAIYAMATAARDAGSCTGADVKDALAQLTSFNGVTGTLDFSERIAEGKLTIGEVVDGSVVPLDQ